MKALADYCGTTAEDMYFHSIFYVGVNKGTATISSLPIHAITCGFACWPWRTRA
ncbi:MAG: hypothetical protein ACLR0U_10265 [Enterocloster clostridioformis]